MLLSERARVLDYHARRERLRNPPNAVADTPVEMKNGHPMTIVPINPESISTIQNQVDAARAKLASAVGRKTRVKAQFVQIVVCAYRDVTIEEMLSRSRMTRIVMARQIAIYLCRELTGLSLVEVGKNFAGRDHTTVLSGVRKIAHLRKKDSELDAELTELTRQIKSEI